MQWENNSAKRKTQNGLKLVAQCLHLASLQVFHNQSLYSGNLECMSIQISAAWQSRTDSLSFFPGFSHSQTNHSFLFQSPVWDWPHDSLLQRVKGWSRGHPFMAAFMDWWWDILYGPHTLWLTALLAVCVLMEACWTETWMMFSGCPLFKPEDDVRSALLSLLTVDQKRTSLQYRHMKIQSNWSIWFRCRLEVQLYKHFSELEMILFDELNFSFLSQRSSFIATWLNQDKSPSHGGFLRPTSIFMTLKKENGMLANFQFLTQTKTS